MDGYAAYIVVFSYLSLYGRLCCLYYDIFLFTPRMVDYAAYFVILLLNYVVVNSVAYIIILFCLISIWMALPPVLKIVVLKKHCGLI